MAAIVVERPKFGRTALWWAVEKGHTDIARLLVDHGADMNIPTEVSECRVGRRMNNGCRYRLLYIL
jgi:ankyrin repeat protein